MNSNKLNVANYQCIIQIQKENFIIIKFSNYYQNICQILQTPIDFENKKWKLILSGCFDDECEVRGCNIREAEIQKLVCNHEEADTRIPISILQCNCSWCFALAKDTDVFVELLALHPLFAQKNKRVFMKWTNGWLNMTRMAEKLIEKGVRLRSLPLLHEISGSDQVSFMYGIGKATAWKTFLDHQVILLL